MKQCKRCGSYAINHHAHGRDGSEPELCDVCYWRKRSEEQIKIDVQLCRSVPIKTARQSVREACANAIGSQK